MTKTDSTRNAQLPFSCLGCGITLEDIDRLRLDIRFPAAEAPRLSGTGFLLSICARCIDSPEALARALAKEISPVPTLVYKDAGTRWKVIAALLALRDKAALAALEAAEARVSESAAMFAKAGETVVPWFNLAGERLDRIEHHLGLDVAKPAKNQRAKNGLMGMLGGALIGAIVGSAARPLEALKAVIDKGHELVEDALRRGAEK